MEKQKKNMAFYLKEMPQTTDKNKTWKQLRKNDSKVKTEALLVQTNNKH